MKYGSRTCYGSKEMAKVNFFFENGNIYVKGQGRKVKNVGTDRKVMSQGIHM